eukprot:7376587-Prymnesium_polylepis.1
MNAWYAPELRAMMLSCSRIVESIQLRACGDTPMNAHGHKPGVLCVRSGGSWGSTKARGT